MVDCGPGRYAIWREMNNERAESIVSHLNQIFCERGPVHQILMDNSTAFRSEKMAGLLSKWGVSAWFRAAYKASGNGIVERHHRTIKSMAERSGENPVQAVFYYNISPKKGQDDNSVPYRSVHSYDWKMPWIMSNAGQEEEGQPVIQEGEEVWVRRRQ